jgi:hypothetical protein
MKANFDTNVFDSKNPGDPLIGGWDIVEDDSEESIYINEIIKNKNHNNIFQPKCQQSA